MKIAKSFRHSRITGYFAQGVVHYWLSEYGCECAHADHVGLEIGGQPTCATACRGP